MRAKSSHTHNSTEIAKILVLKEFMKPVSNICWGVQAVDTLGRISVFWGCEINESEFICSTSKATSPNQSSGAYD